MNDAHAIEQYQEATARIRQRLAKVSMSSRALARAIGVDDKTVRLFLDEKRDPLPATVGKMAAWLDSKGSEAA